jgi:CHAT domain-containing protein
VSKKQVRFEDFVLNFDASSRGGFRARVLKSPFGEGVVRFSLPAVADAASQDPPGVSRDIGHQAVAATAGARPPLEIGTELFRSVFQGQVRTLLDKSRGQLEISPNLGLRLKIKLDPSDEETGALADLPWELLCDGETEDFFALSRQTSLVRYLDVPRSSQPIPFTPPLRILAVAASPRSLPPLDLEEEARRLEDLNRSSSGIAVRFLAHASAGAVREALAGDTYNALHFMGHGTFDRASGEGMLAFEGPGGTPDLVSGKAFATKLKDLRSLGVVVLNACNTARALHQEGANPFRGVATALVLGGVPAVVAMQRPISDLAAIGFSTAFYRHLARGDSIDEALTEGRQAIHSAKPETFEWATPVLFLRMPEGNVFVAKPADRPAEMAPPPPPPPPPPLASAVPRSVMPAPGPVSVKRGPAVKIAAGAAGAVLVVIVLYTKVLNPASDATQPDSNTSSGILKPPPSDPKLNVEPTPKAGRDDGSDLRTARDRQTDRVLEGKGSISKPPASGEQQSSSPAPVVPAPIHSPSTAETAASTADLSSLSAQVLSIARRGEGGLRVTVSFKNAAGLPLSVVLDAEGSVLTDDQGGRPAILYSNLPYTGSNPRLDLAPGASSRHTFDFPMPKLGSKQFYLALLTQDGRRVNVSGNPLTLEGSP